MRRVLPWLHAASPAVPGAVLIWFGFNSGGFFPGATAVVALALAVFLVLRLTLAEEPLAGVSPALVVAPGALAALAAWALVSSAWSHAPGRAMLEFSRDLTYLLAVAAFGCAAFRPERFAQAVRFLAVAVFVVCAAGLITRMLPDLWTIEQRLATDRLSYPLTYWNALGLLAGLGTVLALHLTSSAGEPPAVRVLGAALAPALVTTAYLTFSRGGIAAGLVGLIAFLLIGRPAHLPGALLAVVPACALALVTAVGADALATLHPTSPAGVADGHRLALAVALATVAAAALRALTLCDRPPDRRAPGRPGALAPAAPRAGVGRRRRCGRGRAGDRRRAGVRPAPVRPLRRGQPDHRGRPARAAAGPGQQRAHLQVARQPGRVRRAAVPRARRRDVAEPVGDPPPRARHGGRRALALPGGHERAGDRRAAPARRRPPDPARGLRGARAGPRARPGGGAAGLRDRLGAARGDRLGLGDARRHLVAVRARRHGARGRPRERLAARAGADHARRSRARVRRAGDHARARHPLPVQARRGASTRSARAAAARRSTRRWTRRPRSGPGASRSR